MNVQDESIANPILTIEDMSDGQKAKRQAQLDEFHAQFRDVAPMNKKKRRKIFEMSDDRFESYKFSVVVSDCCRYMDIDRIYAAYKEAKRNNVYVQYELYSSLISLVAGFGDQGCNATAPPRTVIPPSDVNAAREIFTDMQKACIPFGESIYTAMIRCYSLNNAEKEALELYKEMIRPFTPDERTKIILEPGQDNLIERYERPFLPKLRTFSPLMLGFSLTNDWETCIWIYKEMTERFMLLPMERDYVALLGVLVETKQRSTFYTILDAFMEDHLVPKKSTWDILKKWFEVCENGEDGKDGEEYMIEVGNTSKTGKLECNNQYLQSIDVSDECSNNLLQQIDNLASQRASTIISASAQTGTNMEQAKPIVLGGGKGQLTEKMLERTKQNAKYTEEKWTSFKTWMHEIEKERIDTFGDHDTQLNENINANGNVNVSVKNSRLLDKKLAQESRYKYKYDVIIDGANCGYYKQNYAGAPSHVDYQQIDWMVEHLKRLGYKPLLMLHCRHLVKEKVPSHCAHLVRKWRENETLYETPARCNDDWFWLYLAVKLQCKVITNDEMRDHHFQMLSPRSFARWKERHQIHFGFGEWIKKGSVPIEEEESSNDDDDDDENDAKQKLSGNMTAGSHYRKTWLKIPRCYSNRMQCLIKDGSYAFPCEEDKQWLCCYRRQTKTESSSTSVEMKNIKRKIDTSKETDEGGEIDTSNLDAVESESKKKLHSLPSVSKQ
jgi:pentatricopeptide repeat protein